MTDAVAADCPVCNVSERARERLATARIAGHVERTGRHDEGHRDWIDEHTANGTLAEIHEALVEDGRPRT